MKGKARDNLALPFLELSIYRSHRYQAKHVKQPLARFQVLIGDDRQNI
jgi:hypothetical protein